MADEPEPEPEPEPEAEEDAALEAERENRRRQQVGYITRLMEERFPDPPPCPWCGHRLYNIGEVLNLHPRDGGVYGRSVYTVFQVTCSTCGYVHLFNGRVAGASGALDRAIIDGEDISEADLPPALPAPPQPELPFPETAEGAS